MKVLLNVPYAEKEAAKSVGARWNPDIKSWYLEELTSIDKCAKWMTADNYNILCENLYVFKMNVKCWRCSKETEVMCLATDKSFIVEKNYTHNSNMQLLSYVKSIPLELAEYLKPFRFVINYSKQKNDKYYMNHCHSCGAIQGDYYILEQPKTAFYSVLCYSNSIPPTYSQIKNMYYVPIQAELQYYDEFCNSLEAMLSHMATEAENRASLNITQALMNTLKGKSRFDKEIVIQRL